MQTNKPLYLFFIANILLFCFLLVLLFSQKNTVPLENSDKEVLGVEDQNQFPTFKVCSKDLCQIISSEEISQFYVDGELVKEKVATYLSNNLIPYFSQYYGGKTTISNANGSFVTWVKDIRPDFTTTVDDIYNALLKRENGITIPVSYDIPVSDLPGTDGTYASKYMEVDNSRQKLFVWMNGKVVRTILLSAPVYGFQVYGVFPIVDKGIEPIAPGGKRMPYWMAFYYSKSQDSWYGLHALIWWYDSNGNKVYESTKNILTRQSAGCIRMLLADAQYLYENFDRGDILLIHE